MVRAVPLSHQLSADVATRDCDLDAASCELHVVELQCTLQGSASPDNMYQALLHIARFAVAAVCGAATRGEHITVCLER